MTIEDALDRFLTRLAQLRAAQGGGRRLPEIAGARGLPARGVYFFVDPTEPLILGHPRIVRVGTHAVSEGSRSTLKQRLAQHRGRLAEAGGNHRGSIFRLLVGEALIARGLAPDCPSWGMKGARSAAAAVLARSPDDLAAAEAPVEQAVSAYLSGLEVVFAPVDDAPSRESARGVIERGAIALLAEAARRGLVTPGPDWLGHWSRRPTVHTAALWNQNHVAEPWSPEFLGIFEASARGTEGFHDNRPAVVGVDRRGDMKHRCG